MARCILKKLAFAIRLILPQSQPSLFIFGLLLLLWCFCTKGKYYFKISFNLKDIFSVDRPKTNNKSILAYSSVNYNGCCWLDFNTLTVISCNRAFLTWVLKVIRVCFGFQFALLRVRLVLTFARASHRPRVFASSFDWFTGLFFFLGFTTLNWKLLYHKNIMQ